MFEPRLRELRTEVKSAEEAATVEVTRLKESELEVIEREEKRIKEHEAEILTEVARTAEV